jgi:hypothetical protein
MNRADFPENGLKLQPKNRLLSFSGPLVAFVRYSPTPKDGASCIHFLRTESIFAVSKAEFRLDLIGRFIAKEK